MLWLHASVLQSLAWFSVFTGDLDGIPKSSPASNPPGPGPGPGPGGPGTPRDDNGEMTGQLFPPFQDNVSV